MVVRRTRSVRSWLRGIDSRDYRRRRVPFHCFNCPALRLSYGRPGTCEPHPSPPSQVDRCYRVSVHYYSTFTAPELAGQSFVRLESLPASRTSHTGTSGLTPRQTNHRQACPSSLVLYLPLSFSETPPVHHTPKLSTLTVTLTVEAAYAFDILQNYRGPLLSCNSDDPFRHIMKDVSCPDGSPASIL